MLNSPTSSGPSTVAPPAAAVPAPRPQIEAITPKSEARPAWIGSLLKHAVLLACSVVFLLPFYVMISSALKTKEEIFAMPPVWFPWPLQWENFIIALDYPGFPYFRLLGNTLFYTGSVTIGTVISCAAVGYGFARLRFPGRDILFAITLGTMMIPAIVTFIPTYVLFANAGLTGTYAPLIIPKFLGDAFFIFMMRQFFRGVPVDLSDAARLDGAGEFRIFWEIMLPLVRPALVVVAVFSILWTWQDFFGPLIYLQDQLLYPLSLGLFAFQNQRTTEWPLIMAGAVLTILPLVIMFIFTQRYFIRGVTMTGLKG